MNKSQMDLDTQNQNSTSSLYYNSSKNLCHNLTPTSTLTN